MNESINNQTRTVEAEVHNLFEVEELERRLEMKASWDGSAGVDSNGTCTATLTCHF